MATRVLSSPLAAALARPLTVATVVAGGSPSSYNVLLSDTLDDGREVVSFSWSHLLAAGLSVVDGSENLGGAGVGDIVAAFSFEPVGFATCSEALLTLELALIYAEYPGTITVKGEKNNSAASTARWATGKRPSSTYIAPAGNVATTALATVGADIVTVVAPQLKVVDVTDIISEIMGSAQFSASTSRINLFAYISSGLYGGFDIGHVGSGTPARLQITPA